MNNDYWNRLTFIRSVSNLCDVIARSTTDVLRVVSTSYSDMVSVSRQSVRLIYDTLSLLELLTWVRARHTSRLHTLFLTSSHLIAAQSARRWRPGLYKKRRARAQVSDMWDDVCSVAGRPPPPPRPTGTKLERTYIRIFIYNVQYDTIILKSYGAERRRPTKRSPRASVGIHSHNNIHRNSLYI